MDAVIDEDRQITAAFTSSGDDPYDGSPNLFSVRTGGGRDVTLTLPDGLRATFLFTPAFRVIDLVTRAYAEWKSPPGVTAVLTMIPLNPSGANEINFYQNGFGKPVWSSGDRKSVV